MPDPKITGNTPAYVSNLLLERIAVALERIADNTAKPVTVTTGSTGTQDTETASTRDLPVTPVTPAVPVPDPPVPLVGILVNCAGCFTEEYAMVNSPLPGAYQCSKCGRVTSKTGIQRNGMFLYK